MTGESHRATSSPESAAGRFVTLVLVTPAGDVLGVMPELALAQPWWPEAADVVAAARSVFGIDVVVLRLLAPAAGPARGGRLCLLAETSDPVPPQARPWTGELTDHPRRVSWARPGGPDSHLRWAATALGDRGITLAGPPVQQRTWNLSTTWRLPTDAGALWLKVLAPFLGPEGRLLTRLDSPLTPKVLAHDGHRSLLTHLPGAPAFQLDDAALREVIESFVGLQVSTATRCDELLDVGLLDGRRDRVVESATRLVQRRRDVVSPAELAQLERLVGTLSDRFDELAACGLPDTLVHGDFGPHNVFAVSPQRPHERGDAGFGVLDWGEASIGHPLLDAGAFDRPAAGRDFVRACWTTAWLRHYPQSDPDRAARLIEPVRVLRAALTYQSFLDGIEDSERIYHEQDVPEQLTAAARAHAGEA